MTERTFIWSHVGLRGVAACGVVLYHLCFEQGIGVPFLSPSPPVIGRFYLLVDLFFILSGFVLSLTSGCPLDRPGGVRRFAVGRFARIYPLHIFCLTLLVSATILLTVAHGFFRAPESANPWSRDSLFNLIQQIFLLNAWTGTVQGWNYPTWSISAEIAAYIAFPIIAVVLRKWRQASIPLGIAAMLFLAFGYENLDITSGLPTILRCVAGFSVGMTLYQWRGAALDLSNAVLSALQLAAVCCAALVLSLPVRDGLIIPCFSLLIWSTSGDRGIVAMHLRLPFYQWLGERSYAIYLLHIVVMRTAGPIVGGLAKRGGFGLNDLAIQIPWSMLVIATTGTLAATTLRFVEKPARSWLTRRLAHSSPNVPVVVDPAP